jgi:hypothetical protein
MVTFANLMAAKNGSAKFRLIDFDWGKKVQQGTS